MTLQTLKKRSEFLRIRGGRRFAHPAFVLETKPRVLGEAAAVSGPRFGFTVTKKIGNAVVRNRIRRRLKEAIRRTGIGAADPAADYVLIARNAAAEVRFDTLCSAVADAIRRTSKNARAPQMRKPAPAIAGTPLSRDERPLSLARKNRQTGGQRDDQS